MGAAITMLWSSSRSLTTAFLRVPLDGAAQPDQRGDPVLLVADDTTSARGCGRSAPGRLTGGWIGAVPAAGERRPVSTRAVVRGVTGPRRCSPTAASGATTRLRPPHLAAGARRTARAATTWATTARPSAPGRLDDAATVRVRVQGENERGYSETVDRIRPGDPAPCASDPPVVDDPHVEDGDPPEENELPRTGIAARRRRRARAVTIRLGFAQDDAEVLAVGVAVAARRLAVRLGGTVRRGSNGGETGGRSFSTEATCGRAKGSAGSPLASAEPARPDGHRRHRERPGAHAPPSSLNRRARRRSALQCLACSGGGWRRR